MSNASRRNPRKENLWRSRFAEFQASGLSVREFCRQRSITEPTFYAWRKELSRRDAEQARNSERVADGKMNGQLIPVAVVEAKAESRRVRDREKLGLEICTPSGFRLRFDHDTNPETVSQLLDVLTRCAAGGAASC